MSFDNAKFKSKLVVLLKSAGIPHKDLSVGPMGSVMMTFFGEDSARKAAVLLSPVIRSANVFSGYDPGVSTPMCGAGRKEVAVWRVAGQVGTV